MGLISSFAWPRSLVNYGRDEYQSRPFLLIDQVLGVQNLLWRRNRTRNLRTRTKGVLNDDPAATT